jgi:hypothetical protein
LGKKGAIGNPMSINWRSAAFRRPACGASSSVTRRSISANIAGDLVSSALDVAAEKANQQAITSQLSLALRI